MIEIRRVGEADRQWVAALFREHWYSSVLITRGRRHDATELEGLVALSGGERCGLLTYRMDGDSWELVSLNSLDEGRGIGTRLVNPHYS